MSGRRSNSKSKIPEDQIDVELDEQDVENENENNIEKQNKKDVVGEKQKDGALSPKQRHVHRDSDRTLSPHNHNLPTVATETKHVGNHHRHEIILSKPADATEAHNHKRSLGMTLKLSFQALGVIYGDIGTSPLYTLKTLFPYSADTYESQERIIGGLSLVIWSLLLAVTFKYVICVLNADNRGEGGIFALLALLKRSKGVPRVVKYCAPILAICSAAFLFGDGALTPAISILSAVEGLEVEAASLRSAVVPITLVIIVLLFSIQSLGTGKVSGLFSPFMAIWFFAIGGLGIANLISQPAVWLAFNPWEGINFMIKEASFKSLGAVFLAVTGMEALYADLGHFGASSVRISWCLVLPCLLLNYLGQAAFLIGDTSADQIGRSNPFFNMVVHVEPGLYWPMLIIAAIASVIASQAMISGVFSVVKQAIGLTYFPPVSVVHTSKSVIGQIYISLVNWWLFIVTCGIVIIFQTSEAIGHIYGFTIAADSMITTFLFFFALIWFFKFSPLYVFPVVLLLLFFLIDLVFLIGQASKIPEGGWFSLVMAAFYIIAMLSWYIGGSAVQKVLLEKQIPRLGLAELRKRLKKPSNISLQDTYVFDEYKISNMPDFGRKMKLGTLPRLGVFLIDIPEDQELEMQDEHEVTHRLPSSLITLVDSLYVVPEMIVLLEIRTAFIPTVNPDNRIMKICRHHDKIIQISAQYGYAEDEKQIIELMHQCVESFGLQHWHDHHTNYFLDQEVVDVTVSIKKFHKFFFYHIYAMLKRIFPNRPRNADVPQSRVVEIATQVELSK